MLRKMFAGETSQSIPIVVKDTSSTTGAGISGLVFNSSGLTAKYRRQGASTWTSITLVTATLGTWTSGGFISDGGTAGGYELGIPNAAIASGAEWVQIQVYGATNMLAVNILIELDKVNYQDAVRAGLTALPNVSSGTAGALLVDGTGTAAISNSAGKVLLQATQAGVTIPTVTTVTNAVTIDMTTVLPTSPVANTVGEALVICDIMAGRIGTAQAGTTNTITLDAGAASDNNAAYVGDDVYLYGGTGGGARGTGQRRTIISYDRGTKIATVNRAWSTTPDNTSKFVIMYGSAPAYGSLITQSVATALPVDVQTIKQQTVVCPASVTIGAFVGNATAALVVSARGSATVSRWDDGATFTPIRMDAGSNFLLTSIRFAQNGDNQIIDIPFDFASGYFVSVVAGYATGQDPGTFVLSNPAHKLVTNVDGSVNADVETDILSEIVEGDRTVRDMLKILGAALAGKVSGGGSTTLKFRDTNDTLDRITAVVDGSKNRTSITFNLG